MLGKQFKSENGASLLLMFKARKRCCDDLISAHQLFICIHQILSVSKKALSPNSMPVIGGQRIAMPPFQVSLHYQRDQRADREQ